jgi:hypothetical protein
LLFKDWRKKVEKLNEAVVVSKCKCRLFPPREFLIGSGNIIGAAKFAKRGTYLFAVKDQGGEEEEDEVWASFCPEPHFQQYMLFSRYHLYQQLMNFMTFIRVNYMAFCG